MTSLTRFHKKTFDNTYYKIEDYKKMIIQEMENALEPIFKISVPLSVDSNYANNWNEAH